MELLKISPLDNMLVRTKNPIGFTLIEVLVVISIMTIVIAGVFSLSLRSSSGTEIEADVLLVHSLLRQARAKSVAQVCSFGDCAFVPKQGVFVSMNSVTLFEGESYAIRGAEHDVIIPLHSNSSAESSGEILFLPGSGDTTKVQTITLSDEFGFSSTLTVSEAGGIFVTYERD